MVLHICFEGLSYTGKTTHALRLIDTLKKEGRSVFYNKSVPTKQKETGKFIKRLFKLNLPDCLREELYCLDLVYDNYDISRRLEEGISVVQDRSVISYLAFNKIYCKHVPLVLEGRVRNGKVNFLKPGVLFLLKADKEERIKRSCSSERLSITEYERQELYGNVDLQLEREMDVILAKYPNVILIDTNRRTIDEIAKEVLAEVKLL